MQRMSSECASPCQTSGTTSNTWGCNRSKILSYKADYKSAVCDFFSALVQQSSEVPPVLVLRSTYLNHVLSNSTLVFLRRWLHSYVRFNSS